MWAHYREIKSIHAYYSNLGKLDVDTMPTTTRRRRRPSVEAFTMDKTELGSL